MIIETPSQSKKHSHRALESKIQVTCVAWLWNNYPETRGNFIHIPNEGNRANAIDGAMRKAMGLIAGAPDMFLFMARKGKYGLAIEFKTDVGAQRKEQIAFQARLEHNGYAYYVCRSFEQFRQIITEYFSGK